MFSSDYKWQHDYVRLVSDTGFRFERHKPDNFDKNRISSIDIDQIIEERDFETIDKLIPSISKFVLDQEQAQILDDSFVKTFLLSQLAIQYLLYCKKYLDNTLIIAKAEIKQLKEDKKELNLFVDDLKTHISNLMKEIDDKPTFICSQCNKNFSTEEFLNSHIKRRHSTVEIETDKLEMEIKELKGRLNNAEKMIQKEQGDVEVNSKDVEVKKIEDLQQKFEDLRLQVQSELKVLQTQHNFQEKYEKLFEKMTLQGSGKFSGGGDSLVRRESTTQTETGVALQEASAKIPKFEEKNKENIPEVAQKQMAEIGEALETKVTSSLKKIENQMESFWIKLNDMERYRKTDDSIESEAAKPKPVVRSRTKYTVKNLDSEGTSRDNTSPKKKSAEEWDSKLHKKKITEELKQPVIVNVKLKKPTESEETEESSFRVEPPPKKEQPVKQITPKKLKNVEVEIMTDPDETTTSETLASESKVETHSKPLPVPRKRSHSSSTKKTEGSELNDELLKQFKIEVEKIIMGRLQDLGVSPEWKGLPTRSFQRAMEIVNHQANLMKKTYPNFDILSTQIEKSVTKNLDELLKQERKVIKAKPKKTGKGRSNRVEIKNRSMYDTESDSEIRPLQVKENLHQFSVPYSAVIEELKAVTSKIDSSDKEVIQPAIKIEDQTKGVLKSYPSVGSLTKKKVLFNLDTDEKKDAVKESGGSTTTSVASSVFDATPRKDLKQKVKEKDIEDLSDFDFSDM